MVEPLPRDAPPRAAAVIVPVKAFTVAKLRLAPTLDPATRSELARTMAALVLRAAGPLPVLVVCDDEEVRAWAERRGRTVQTRYAAKVKTAVQLTFLIAVQVFLVASKLTRFDGWVGEVGAFAGAVLYGPVTNVLLLVTVLLTLWTGARYFVNQPAPSL